MSDNSASPYSDSSVLSGEIVAGTYSIDFKAASPGQTLTVTYTATNVDWDAILLEAVALTPKHPDVTVVQPSLDQSFAAPASFTASVQASEVSGSINSVALFQNGASAGTLSAPPYNFAVDGLAAGNYQFSAQASDGSSRSQTSPPVPIHVVGTGGELVSFISAPPASVDRHHWERQIGCSWEGKTIAASIVKPVWLP